MPSLDSLPSAASCSDLERTMTASSENQGNDGFFSDEPMTDEEFNAFVVIENDEVPISSVSFSKQLCTVVDI